MQLPYDVEDDSKCSAVSDKSGKLKITMPVKQPPLPPPLLPSCSPQAPQVPQSTTTAMAKTAVPSGGVESLGEAVDDGGTDGDGDDVKVNASCA